MIRGGHIDLSVLGAMEVDEEGNIANWMIPEKWSRAWVERWIWWPGLAAWSSPWSTPLATAAKILNKCTLPLTGVKVVNMIVTEMAVIQVTPTGLVLEEIAPGLPPKKCRRSLSPG